MEIGNAFGQTATKLSHNPLGIIALFIVLVYGFASLVVGIGQNLDENSVLLMVLFLVLFPVLVLGVFGWLVSRHHEKLYAPRDYQEGEHFLQAMGIGFETLEYAEPKPSEPGELPGEEQDIHTPRGRREQRRQIYEESRKLFLAHIVSPSSKPGQLFDIQIYLKRHKGEPIEDVKSTAFFFGSSWGNRIFDGTREGNVIGVSTSAYGSFLCTCLVTFTDGSEVVLDRYIDFEMGEVLKRALMGASAA